MVDTPQIKGIGDKPFWQANNRLAQRQTQD